MFLDKMGYDKSREMLRDLILNESLTVGHAHPDGSWIFDNRKMFLGGDGLLLTAELMYDKIKDHAREFDVLVADGIGAYPLLSAISILFSQNGSPIKCAYVREKKKAYGLKKQIEGPEVPVNARVWFIDDLINSGTTLSRALSVIGNGAHLVGVSVLIDFNYAGSRQLKLTGKHFYSIFTRYDVGVSRVKPTTDKPVLEKIWAVNNVNLGSSSVIRATPVFYKNRIIINTDQMTTQCYDRDTGQLIWTYEGRNKHPKGRASIPVIYEDKIYITGYDGYISLIEGDTGREVTAKKVADFIHGTPCLDPSVGLVYVGTETYEMNGGKEGGSIVCMTMDLQTIVWEVKTPGYVPCSPLRLKTFSDVVCGSNDCNLYSVRFNEGVVHWKTPTGSKVIGFPQQRGSFIYVTNATGDLICLDALLGKIEWRDNIATSIVHGKVEIFGDNVLTATNKNMIWSHHFLTGRRNWVLQLDSSVWQGFTPVKGNLYLVISVEGWLYLIDVEKGKKVWATNLGIKCHQPVGYDSATKTVAIADNDTGMTVYKLNLGELGV